MKKLISLLTALAMGGLFALSAAAAEPAAPAFSMQVDMSHVYISDAVIQVGDTYTWSYDGEAGPVDYGEEGTALKIVSGQPNDQGGMTFVYEAVAPGTHTFRIVDRWWMQTYERVTVTVEEAGSTGDTGDAGTVEETPAEQPAGQPAAPAASHSESAPAQSQEPDQIGEAIANGTWGAEYTTCPACGYHNWTAGPEGYVCDTCGYITTWVKTASGVKGYVGAQMPVQAAAAASAPAVSQQTAAEAQAANDAYLAAIRALQAQVAQREAAYLAALKG